MKIKCFVLAIGLVAIFKIQAQNKVWYVNQEAMGANNGSGWTNGFNDLQDAFAVSKMGDTIAVAKGIYLPTDGYDRTESFYVPYGVKILGGFLGNEPITELRDHKANKTILSGDIGEKGSRMDNVYHVVVLDNSDSTTLLDGFYVQDGFAFNDTTITYDHLSGGGLVLKGFYGNQTLNPIISNCIFRNNYATDSGGAIFCTNSNDETTNPSIRNSIFENNYAGYGGAVSKTWKKIDPDFVVANCSFDDNNAIGGGGAIYFNQLLGTVVFRNCNFTRDTSLLQSASICFDYINQKPANIVIEKCSFEDNYSEFGAAISLLYSGVPNQQDSISVSIDSSYFYNNRSRNGPGGVAIIYNAGGSQISLVTTNSIFENNRSKDWGGCFFVWNSSNGKLDFISKNCIYSKNKSNSKVTSVLFYQGFQNKPNATINFNNCMFSRNQGVSAALGGDNCFIESMYESCTFFKNGIAPLMKNTDSTLLNSTNKCSITNSILWESVTTPYLFYNNNPGSLHIIDYQIESSIVNLPNCQFGGIDVAGDGMIYQEYPMFRDSATGDFRIPFCSPAANAGNKNLTSIDNIKDVLGNKRIFGNQVDIGAIEAQDSNLNIFATIQNIELPDTSTGSILIDSISGGWPPYAIAWDTGQSTFNIEGLNKGNYIASVIDSVGCESSHTFTIDEIVSAINQHRKEGFRVYPNPMIESAFIDINDTKSEQLFIELYQVDGKEIKRLELVGNPYIIEKGLLHSGIFLFKILNRNGAVFGDGKLMVR